MPQNKAKRVHQLISTELKELATKMHDIVDELALQGVTFPLENLFKNITDMKEEERQFCETFTQELLEKYGPAVPINTIHRISWELEGYGQMWSVKPGCFERHLQRRDGSLLFPKERRIVSQKEIVESIEKDHFNQAKFKEKVNKYLVDIKAIGQQITPTQLGTLLIETQAFIEEAASIGGNIEHDVQTLEEVEEILMQLHNDIIPDSTDALKKLHDASVVMRFPFEAQFSRKDSPILKEEEIPALLSEDYETISFNGFLSRVNAPNYRPNESDIQIHIDKAVAQGFSKDRAANIISAWNKIEYNKKIPS